MRLLPTRQQNILKKYAMDSSAFLKEMRRVIQPNGKLCLVLGDSNVRGQHVANSKLFAHLADAAGFQKISQRRRALKENRRYLPITSANKRLENRMRYEVIQTYVARN
jgi:ubiquinone/menaquinone biosynthesis C-methylase UbiE